MDLGKDIILDCNDIDLELQLESVDQSTYIKTLYGILTEKYKNIKWKSNHKYTSDDYYLTTKQCQKYNLNKWKTGNYQWNHKLSLKQNMINYVAFNNIKQNNIPTDLKYKINLKKFIMHIITQCDPFSTCGYSDYDISIVGDIEKEALYRKRIYGDGVLMFGLPWDLDDADFYYYIHNIYDSLFREAYYKYHLIESKKIKPGKRNPECYKCGMNYFKLAFEDEYMYKFIKINEMEMVD